MVSNSTICIIPARGGSKGLPRKNTLKICGHPLISYPIANAFASGICDYIFVSTDDEEIAKIAKSYGAKVPFLREKKYAQDLTTTEDTLKNALLNIENYLDLKFENCVFLTATDIFRNPKWLNSAKDIMDQKPEIESVFAVNRTHKNFWYENKMGEYERILPSMKEYSSRQIRKAIYREDTGLSCISRAFLWRDGRRIGDKVDFIVNDRSESSFDIHTAFDLYIVEKAIEWLRKNEPENAPTDPSEFING